MSPTQGKRRAFLIIVTLYVIVALTYALATPPLEASDEYKHYPVVDFIANNWQLPVLSAQNPGRWLQEGAQPPLYYLLMAILSSAIDTVHGDVTLDSLHQTNKHAYIGIPNQVGNKNIIFHDPAQESFPWRGAVLAIYWIRLASIGLGVGSLWITWRLAQLWNQSQKGAQNDSLPLLATGLMAFNPMFLFVSAAVNNDSLAILLGHAGLFQLARIVQKSESHRESHRESHPESDPEGVGWQEWLWMGILIGLAVLTKLSLGALMLPVTVCFIWAWLRTPRLSHFLRNGFALGIPILGLCGWWLLRNFTLYGDLTGLSAFVEVQGTRSQPLDWAEWVREFGTFYRSFWGLFGGVNILAPEWIYQGYNWLVLLSVPGILLLFGQMIAKRNLLRFLFILWVVVLAALLIRWNIISPAFQGRLLFPALGAISTMIGAGLLVWFERRRQHMLAIGLTVAAFSVAAILPWTTIRPVYAYPQSLGEIANEARFGPIQYQKQGADAGIRLIGVEIAPGQRVYPVSNPVEIVLYWQASGKIQGDYLSSLHLIGRNAQSVGQVDRTPANGMIQTSRWQTGAIYRDRYHIYVHGDAVTPARLQVRIALHDPQNGEDLNAVGPDGAIIDPLLVGEVSLGGAAPRQLPANLLSVQFDSGVQLVGYDSTTDHGASDLNTATAGELLQLDLRWKASFAASHPALPDYSVFIHLLNSAGNQVAGADGDPVQGQYPSYLWQPNEEIVDQHEIQLPADLPIGDYTLSIGLYEKQSGIRPQRVDGGDSVVIALHIRE